MKGCPPNSRLLLLLLLLSLDPGAGECLGYGKSGDMGEHHEGKGAQEDQLLLGDSKVIGLAFSERVLWCAPALILPPSSTCCTQLYRQPLSNKLLRKVIRVELQEVDGDCHLQAFV